jgi:hypothetical protein
MMRKSNRLRQGLIAAEPISLGRNWARKSRPGWFGAGFWSLTNLPLTASVVAYAGWDPGQAEH